ncbi:MULTISPECIES: hypothetical protein [unclassified Variovorax]|jgi:hypothetical protein|uniref:hypothetical protein n=1 Tax=unclassified Variovorax TaxID=663243 RepID=UPI000D12F26F|nr:MULTISPECIES: hypothetical protein [unclassified Variovorax]AVQ81807.1 hypothetical protein C4F17_13060 [Variovorax sp. PMC12]QRY33933.1 hypothetical protein JVX96_11840 [Variovorax sp. PDNC026]
MTHEEQFLAAAEAAGRLGDIDALDTQISGICSMLHALYMAHPAKEQVRRQFDRLMAKLLDSPYVIDEPDRALVLRATASALLTNR